MAVWPPFQAEMVPFRLAKMKLAGAPLPPFPTGRTRCLYWRPGRWGLGGSASRWWDDDIAVGPHRGRFRDGIAGRHREESGCIGTLVRNPKRARGIVGNTPRVMQFGSVMAASPGISETRFV